MLNRVNTQCASVAGDGGGASGFRRETTDTVT